MGRSRSRTLAIAAIILTALIILTYIIPIKSKSIGYCKLNPGIKTHYSWLRGDSTFFNSDLINSTVDRTGLMCNAGEKKVSLYIW